MREAEPLLDMDLMRTLVAISDTGSFASAAQQVHRTPSAVSMQIKKLEEQVGRELFERDGRRLVLTTDGESLLGFGRQLLALNSQAVQALRGDSLRGAIRFGAPDDFGTRFLPGILSRFAASHPDVEVSVALGPSSQLQSQFESDELDVMLVSSVPRRRASSVGKRVFAEPLVWVGAKGGKALDREVLPLALAGIDCEWRTAALRALAAIDRKHRVAYTCENCAGQLAAVSADLAVAPIPRSLVTDNYQRLGSRHGLPTLENYELRMIEANPTGSCEAAFAAHVIDSFASEH